MKNLTLVVMAAGMGSRFGGLKQITPVDEDGNFLIDYSVFDAIKAGFSKVVFIIKRENLEVFRETIGKKLQEKITVEYAFQDLEDIPDFIQIPRSRVKPWGTVHAVLAARPYIDGAFAIINADDFYGYSSYQQVADFLRSEDDAHVSIPYPFCNVDSKYGFVKRGVLDLDGEDVVNIIECNVGYEDGKVLAKPLCGKQPFEIQKDHPVSMNLFGFQQDILDEMEAYFIDFMKKNQDHLETVECLVPEFLREYLENKRITLKYRTSNGLWLGMTYKEDLDEVKEKLEDLKNKGEYPRCLWED